ncbi:MAG: DUF4197 domain-containing protein [Bacteroidia bacterium]|nr:DUF4197 domain-containing protein [Bacteroidia bacterium]MCX7652004.1 DUF4197 domain-containing protein [Bacteroidia bacterium]MDW8416325.1 DUF4197 domain-containing protein [Bacteroidia bacterium]
MRTIAFLIGPLSLAWLVSCEKLENLQESPLSEQEIVAALKEALRVSTDTTVRYLNRLDGYYGDELIRILFPPDAQRLRAAIEVLPGGQQLIQDLIVKMNRAAEEAADEAKPIFWNAITELTIQDGMNILKGDSIAATRYLRDKTYDSLYIRYKPKIQEAMESVGAQQAWEYLVDTYNSLPTTLNPITNRDLAAYVTDRALYGLFLKVGQHETRIRRDVSYRVTDLLRRVFAHATG